MRQTLLTLSIILAATDFLLASELKRQTRTAPANVVRQPNKKEWNTLKQRFRQRSGLLAVVSWNLIDTAKSRNEVKQCRDISESIHRAIAFDDPSLLKQLDGPRGFKNQLARLMKSNDETVAGYAALILAVIGDLNYAPQIADLLEKPGDLTGNGQPPVTIRGNAALALGLLGARKYTERIFLLLRSKNSNDRMGATMALGYLKATEHAKDVVELLLRKDLSFPDDDTPIASLVNMGVAASYKKEIAQALADEELSERLTAAIYALAYLRAREFAPDIAKLLRLKSEKGKVAKALALMGAKEYAEQIALMLNDESSDNRLNAALALGILGATEYAPAVAKLLSDQDVVVTYYAAVSLVLMGAKLYARNVVSLINETDPYEVYLSPSMFHPFVEQQARAIDRRLKRAFARMKVEAKRSLLYSRAATSTKASLELTNSRVSDNLVSKFPHILGQSGAQPNSISW